MKILFSAVYATKTFFRSWQWWAFSLLTLFNLYQIWHHAMWRDEIHFWALSLDSPSLSSLIHNGRFDGHPALWIVCLWFLTRITSNPALMQWFHFMCAVGSSVIIMIRAPFSLTTRLLVVAGYYFSFEYLVISRAYVLGVLIAISYTAAYDYFRDRPIWGGVVLGLLANTSVYGAILALAFLLSPAISCAAKRSERNLFWTELKNAGEQSLAFLPLLILSLLVMIPGEGGNFAVDWYWGLDLAHFTDRFCHVILGIIPVPNFSYRFWNTQLFYREDNMLTSLGIAIVLMISICWALRKNMTMLTHFLLTLTGMVLFQYIKYPGGARHNGTLLIAFISSAWLMDSSQRYKGKTTVSVASAHFFTIILIFNLFAYAIASWYHLKNPFSSGKAMADYIREKGISSRPLIGHPEYVTATVAGYLQKPIFMLEPKKPRTYIVRASEPGSIDNPGFNDLVIYSQEVSSLAGTKPLILLNFFNNNPKLKLTHSEVNSITGEDFYLYELLND